VRVTFPLTEPTQQFEPVPGQQTSAVPPLLFDTADLCAVLRISKATIHRLLAAGKLPKPLRLAGLKWRADEIRRWCDAGMPDCKTWEAMLAAQRDGLPS